MPILSAPDLGALRSEKKTTAKTSKLRHLSQGTRRGTKLDDMVL
jgi:hypothetical protein